MIRRPVIQFSPVPAFLPKEMILCGMFAAIISVISQFSIPMPSGVPITVQVFAIALTGVVLGSRPGFFSALVYILAGAVGIPVFANFRGGFEILAGVTGGYIWSYPLLAVFCGLSPKTANRTFSLLIRFVLAAVGLLLLEIIGGLRWAALSGDKTIGAIMAYSLIAFIPKDLCLVIAAIPVGLGLRGQLRRAGCQ